MKPTSALKSLILFSIILLSFKINGQNQWLNTSPLKLGYGVQVWSISPIYEGFRYEQVDDVPNNSGELTPLKNNSFSENRFVLEFENIGEHFHHITTVTGAFDLFKALNGYQKLSERGPEARPFEMFTTQMAGGGWIQDRIGIFAGAQYAYSTMTFHNGDQIILGGNQWGFHATGFLSLDQLLVRATLMHDWIKISKGASKGDARTLDVLAHYRLVNRFGVFAGLSFKSISQKGPKGKPTEDWRNQGVQNQGVANYSYEFPDQSGSVTYFKLGATIVFGYDPD